MPDETDCATMLLMLSLNHSYSALKVNLATFLDYYLSLCYNRVIFSYQNVS